MPACGYILDKATTRRTFRVGTVITGIAVIGRIAIEASDTRITLGTMAAIVTGIIHADTTIPTVTVTLGIITGIIAGMVDVIIYPVVIAVTANKHKSVRGLYAHLSNP